MVQAAFPHADPVFAPFDESVAPDPEPGATLLQVVMDLGHLTGKKYGRVHSLAPRALVIGEVEHLVHPGMECICFKNLHDLVHQVEDHGVDLRMKRAIALAVQSVLIGPFVFLGHFHVGRLIELGVDLQQLVQAFSPALVTQQVDLRDDADAILAACEQAAHIAIIGASFIGIEAAFSLSQRNLAVTVIAPESVPFEQTLGKELGTLVQHVHEQNGITFQLGRTPERFEGTEKVEAVRLDNGERIEADVVLVGIGVMPTLPPLQGLTTQPDGSVKVDASFRATETVFAAGDIATFPDVRTGEDMRIEHWRTAEQQGRIAAHNMAGKKAMYDSVPFFWTAQGKLNIKYVGYAREWDEVIIHGDIAAQDCLVLYVKQNQVVAVAGINRGKQLGMIQELMRLKKMPGVKEVQQGEIDWQRLLSS